MSRTIRTPEQLNGCLLKNDRTISNWHLSFRAGGGDNAAVSAAFDERVESIVGNAPQNAHVQNIDLSLRGITGAPVTAGIAEMLRLLPGLRSFRLQVGRGRRDPTNAPSPSDKEFRDAASLIVGGLARNDKSSLRFFRCEVDCGPEAIVALFARHSELETVQLHCPTSPDFADAVAYGLTQLQSLTALTVESEVEGSLHAILPACFALQLRELTIWLRNLEPRQAISRWSAAFPPSKSSSWHRTSPWYRSKALYLRPS